MGRIVSDYRIRIPEGTEPGSCLEITECIKISSAPETPRGAKEQTWCWRNGRWVIYSESEPPPPTQTITLQGATDALLASGAINDLHRQGCPFVIQAVIECAENEFDEVLTFPGISLNTKTPDNGYGWGVPGVDTGAAPPATVTVEGTRFGPTVDASILQRGIAAETSAPDIEDAPLSSLFFCDNPTCGITACGNATPTDGCRTAFAVYDDGEQPILAQYHISSEGVVTLVDTQTLPATNGLVSGACLGGRVVITDGTCIYTSCGADGFTKVVLPDDVPVGSILQLATAVGSTDHYYALFSTSGVLHSRNGRQWSIALDDLFFPAIPQQNGIKAKGDVVITFGEDANMQWNNSGGGGSWFNRVIDTAGPTDLIADATLDMPNPFNIRYAFLYAVTDSGTDLTVHFSGDDGASWEARRTFAVTVLNPESVTIEASVGASRVNLSWDSTSWVNFNFACECDWVDISPDFDCGSTKMAVCPFDPNAVLMISDGVCGPFARDDVAETPSGTPGVAVVIDILANDRAGSGETLDVSSIAVVPPLPANLQSIVIDPVTGALTATPDDGFTGVITFAYTIDDTAPASTGADVTLIVGDVDPSLLVC